MAVLTGPEKSPYSTVSLASESFSVKSYDTGGSALADATRSVNSSEASLRTLSAHQQSASWLFVNYQICVRSPRVEDIDLVLVRHGLDGSDLSVRGRFTEIVVADRALAALANGQNGLGLAQVDVFFQLEIGVSKQHLD